jgi:hypothetical protein
MGPDFRIDPRKAGEMSPPAAFLRCLERGNMRGQIFPILSALYVPAIGGLPYAVAGGPEFRE